MELTFISERANFQIFVLTFFPIAAQEIKFYDFLEKENTKHVKKTDENKEKLTRMRINENVARMRAKENVARIRKKLKSCMLLMCLLPSRV